LTKKCLYIFYVLHFYIYIFLICITTGSFETIEEDDARHNADDEVDIDNDIPDVELNVSSSSVNTHKHKKAANITPFQKSLINHLKKNDEKESDPDRHLVVSFLPYLKKLNDDQKLDFQIHSLKYLKNISQPQTTPGHSVYSSYPTVPTYYPVTQNMPSNMQYPSNSSVSTHPYSYPYAHHSQSSLPPIEMPINSLNSQYSNTEHVIQSQQYTPMSQHSPSDNS